MSGFANSADVLTYLFAVATQAPFLVLANESLAPAMARGRIGTGTHRVALVLIFSSLFISVWYSLGRIDLLELKPRYSAWIALAGVAGVFLSFKSSTRLLRYIMTPGQTISTAYLTFVGAIPGLTLLALFAVYASIHTTFSLAERAPIALTIASTVLPNLFHYWATKSTLQVAHDHSHAVGASTLPEFSPVAIGSIAVSCLMLPLLAHWGNRFRMALGELGPSAWILLAINMLFTAFLLLSKTLFLTNVRGSSKSRGLWSLATVAGLGVVGSVISNSAGDQGVIQTMLALILVLTCNVAIIAACRNVMSVVNTGKAS